jgi:branched-chain amino acid aminotransferase
MGRSELIWFDGEIVEASRVPPLIFDHALDYGSAVFSGVKCYTTSHGERFFFRLPDHVRRTLRAARLYRMKVPFDEDELIVAHLALARRVPKANYFRPRIWYGEPLNTDDSGRLYTIGGVDPSKCAVHVAIIPDNWQAYLSPDVYEKGVGVIISPFMRPRPNVGLTAAKGASNYSVAQLAKMSAHHHLFERADGKITPCADAVMLTEDGFVSEMTGACVFVVEKNIIRTPPVSDGILPSITRDSIIKFREFFKEGPEIRVERIPLMDLLLAEEVIAVGTAAEVSPIVWIGGYTIGSGKPGPIYQLFRSWFERYLSKAGRKKDPLHFFTYI